MLRDYLTDLFPIMELGTSAKMLSIVPLMNGGGLFETGAGGSAPKHVQQFVKENHLRWDSLGEFLALAASLEFLAQKTDNATAQLLADTLDRATGSVLDENRSPVAQGARARQPRQPLLPGALLGPGARAHRPTTPSWRRASPRSPTALGADEDTIVDELNEVQGSPVDIGGYYHPDDELVTAAMRPSATLQRDHRRDLTSPGAPDPLGVWDIHSAVPPNHWRRPRTVLLAELNVRHTRRHMPTRRVAVDDGYLPTSGPAFGGVLLGAVGRRARARARRGAVRRAATASSTGARDGLDRAAHRAAVPAPDRHPRSRPLAPPHHRRRRRARARCARSSSSTATARRRRR